MEMLYPGGNGLMSKMEVDCRGETCPISLVETRKVIHISFQRDIIEVKEAHSTSKKEILKALKAMGLKAIGIKNGE